MLPTVTQFPSFSNICTYLKQSACQCIWYLPDKGRCCKVRLQQHEDAKAYTLASELFQQGSVNPLLVLANIAERSCCTRHHRNKIWGTGLMNALAIRWQEEIRCYPRTTITKPVPSGKVGASLARSQHVSGQFAPQPVDFAMHAILEGQTLDTELSSEIDPVTTKRGTIYIYTHEANAFKGMIKIGYTGNLAARLQYWSSCGHGIASCLGSKENVRHPERVEHLTHFELLRCWYELRWCNTHHQAHIEWFKTSYHFARAIVEDWSTWMERANPYDRRGRLKRFWQETIAFLLKYGIAITSELMLQIQEVEEGLFDLEKFLEPMPTTQIEQSANRIPLTQSSPSYDVWPATKRGGPIHVENIESSKVKIEAVNE